MVRDKFLKSIDEYGLLSAGDRVVVAVSGGVDSTALLHLLDSVKDKYQLTLQVVHLNHMIRKGDAELDVKYVQDIGSRLHIPVTVECCDVQALAKKEKMGLEAVARKARYDFFKRVANGIGANKIAVGHTADDNVETFLMRLLRGAGLKGLCGITPRRGKIIRPLIKHWRRELEEYVGGLKLVPRRDYTNYESKYLRNRVRMKLIPQLRLYNLNIKEIILQTILLLTRDSEYLEEEADETLEKMIISSDAKSVSLDSAKLKGLDESIKGRIVRAAIEKIKGDLAEVSYIHVRDILAKIDATEDWELHLPGGVYVSGRRGIMTLGLEKPDSAQDCSFSYRLSVPGEVNIGELGKRVRVSFVEDPSEMREDNDAVYVDYAVLGKKIVVRNRREGDKFIPLGMKGSKKIQDLFVDEKIPAQARDRVPIVESGGKIIWVVGIRLDERAKVTEKTKRVVKLELV